MTGIPGCAALIDLVALDRKAGVVLESFFSRGPQAKTLDAESLVTIERCGHELRLLSGRMSSDASRYLGRLQELIEFVLAVDHLGSPRRHGVSAGTREPTPERAPALRKFGGRKHGPNAESYGPV